LLFEVMKLMKDFDANIVSVATAPHDDPARKILVLRSRRRPQVSSPDPEVGFDLVSRLPPVKERPAAGAS